MLELSHKERLKATIIIIFNEIKENIHKMKLRMRNSEMEDNISRWKFSNWKNSIDATFKFIGRNV